MVYDYDGNLWFTTGGFRIDPDRDPAGFLGYISRDYMQQLDTGEEVPLEGNIFFYPLSQGEGTVSVIVANWFGAGIAGLADPNANSAIQSYDNIYDSNWMAQGNAYIAPGVERVDFVAADGSDLDCAEQEYQGTFRVVLAQKQA